MDIEAHRFVNDLYIVKENDIEFFFSYVGYDSTEEKLIFEREDEVITAKLMVNEHQLSIWERALEKLGIEIEHIEE